jgi:hypothetical protein
MLLGFPLDHWNHDTIQNAIASFGRVILWENDNDGGPPMFDLFGLGSQVQGLLIHLQFTCMAMWLRMMRTRKSGIIGCLKNLMLPLQQSSPMILSKNSCLTLIWFLSLRCRNHWMKLIR